MPVRGTMTDIIAFTRTLINDPSGPSSVWQDQQIQDTLDRRRDVIRYQSLRPVQTFLLGGIIQYYEYLSDPGYWEADYQIYNQAYSLFMPDSLVDLLTGRFMWTTNRVPPMLLSGQRYDVYGAAADILEKWAAIVALDFDFTTSQRSYKRSQKQSQLLALAALYRQQAWPIVSDMVRNDLYPS